MNAHSFLDTAGRSGAIALEPAGATIPEAGRPMPLASGHRIRLGLDKPARWGWTLGPFLLLLYWAVLSETGFLDSRILPSPWVAVETAIELVRTGRLQEHLAVSAWRAAQGLVLGTVAGIALALLSGLSLLGGYVIDGLVQLKRGVPVLALIPFMVLWFGVGETMKISVIAITVFVPIYLHTHNALRAIDIRQVELAETLGLSHVQFIRHVVLPGALPGLLLGLRFGVTASWLALVVVEQLNATSGIGYMVTLARNYAQTDVMLVGLVVYALLGLASDAVVRLFQARALSWRRTLAG
ncbi:ABC transporter permease [Sphingomonas sp. JC676]|uniref:ABC transporter permease n=1 Tax=Sphingomonas sp. JC676 TaxID=2768065 RepID=UPI0016584EF7|nr:ABC transporter permease [Sphingomonas sp. JC676]MBC9031161.1 ABC transporter permease [Sphingomonas sp. JC676]